MGQREVERLRAGYEHLNRHGEPPWEDYAADVEWDASRVMPGYGVLHGRDALRLLQDYASAFDDLRIEPEEFIDAGDDVVVVVRDGGRLKGSNSEVFNRFVHRFTFRDGKIVRWTTYTDKDEALADAGAAPRSSAERR